MEGTEPLLEKVAVPPFLLDENVVQSLGEEPPKPQTHPPPPPTWTFSKKQPTGTKLPQTIAHRGYKAKHPENTMRAFQGAVSARADAIETDIHLTKDDVVVLSHDASLKRCFGTPTKIADTTWPQISTLRTLKAPHEPMPRLYDLLLYLSHPSRAHIWLLLDIKPSNNGVTIMRELARTIASVPPAPSPHDGGGAIVPWTERIVLGIWTLPFLAPALEYLPGFPISHIGFSLSYAQKFLATRNVGFNMLQKSLACPVLGRRFVRDAHAMGRPVLGWTVNERGSMGWCIGRGLDGVVTDEVERFNEVKRGWERRGGREQMGLREWMGVFWVNLLVAMFVCRLSVEEWWRKRKGRELVWSVVAGERRDQPKVVEII